MSRNDGVARYSALAGPACIGRRTDPPWTERLRQLIQQHPTFGYRRLWVLLRFRNGIIVNRKAVYRIVKQKQWFVHQRSSTPRPRVHGWVSRASRSNERWAMDVTHIPCGHDGWAHLAAVIDCHDRELIGYEFALRSRAKEAERAVEAACLQRFGTLRPIGAPVLRSDNGLIFQSRRFRQACRDYRLQQEFITPYTPEQNGMIERFFRSVGVNETRWPASSWTLARTAAWTCHRNLRAPDHRVKDALQENHHTPLCQAESHSICRGYRLRMKRPHSTHR